MTHTTYEVTGKMKEYVSNIFSEREEICDKIDAYCRSLGAARGAVRSGPNVTGFIFESASDKPDRWVWDTRVEYKGRMCQSARPQRRSKADKEEWKKIDSFKDNTQHLLNKLFYGDPWGFRPEGTNRFLGVGAKAGPDGRYFVEVATAAPHKDGMTEILRSEYEKEAA